MKRYIMIGAPVTYVRTPPLLQRYFGDGGIDAEVDAHHVDSGDLDSFMTMVRSDATIDGLLVTMPHKKAIIPHLHALSDTARLVGSVNTVKRLPTGELAGAQFDGVALVNALLAAHVPLAKARILLAGAGGAGLAIAQAIAAHGCRSLGVTDLTPGTADAAVTLLGAQFRCDVSVVGIPGRETYDLLINATPLGMDAADPSPFDESLVTRARWIADIVADPPRTRLAAIARRTRAVLVTGLDMVVGQVEPIGRWLLTADVQQ